MDEMKDKIKAPRVPNVKCRTEEQCKAISETLKTAYAKGRRFRKVGFTKAKAKETDNG